MHRILQNHYVTLLLMKTTLKCACGYETFYDVLCLIVHGKDCSYIHNECHDFLVQHKQTNKLTSIIIQTVQYLLQINILLVPEILYVSWCFVMSTACLHQNNQKHKKFSQNIDFGDLCILSSPPYLPCDLFLNKKSRIS